MKVPLVVILLLITSVFIICTQFQRKNIKDNFFKHPIKNIFLIIISVLSSLGVMLVIAYIFIKH